MIYIIIIEPEIASTAGGGEGVTSSKKKALLKRKKSLRALLEGVTFQNSGGKKEALIVTCLSLRSAAPRQTVRQTVEKNEL